MVNKCVTIVSGHSGGHIIPCITLAKKENCKVNVITTSNKFDIEIINKNLNYDSILKLPINKTPKSFLSIPKFIISFSLSTIKTFFFLIKNRPEKIISTGGLISIPAALSAKILKIPFVIYELNVEPGKAVLLMAKLFKNINVCFEATKKHFPKNCVVKVQYPVKFENKKLISKDEALNKLNFDTNKKTIFITGGSQGSLQLNEIAKEFIEKENNLQVIHQIGINDTQDWNHFYRSKNINFRTFSFTDDMETYYQAADLIICRAGAGTLAEIAFLNKEALVVPLKTVANSHQVLNAQQWSKEYPKIKVYN